MSELSPDIVDLIEKHIAEGNIRSQVHPDYPLRILNYTPTVQYGRLWDKATLMCRGLIVDTDWRVVGRPFRKFFNWGEWPDDKQGDYLGRPYTVSEKLDGSLGILYYYDGSWHVATRGSFTSDQAQVGASLLDIYDTSHIPTEGVTPLVEIIYPGNRIVVDYGGVRELVLLAALSTATGEQLAAPWWGGPRAQTLNLSIDDALAHEESNREGFVIRFDDGEMVKVKIDEYVRLHRILTGTNAVRVWEALQDDELYKSMMDRVPDEFYQWVSNVATDLRGQYRALEDEATEAFARLRPLADESRKAFALEATKTDVPDLLFSMLDSKDYSGRIWRRIKPEATKPFVEDDL